MEDLTHTNNFVCVDGEPCRLYKPGHHTHSIHWRQAHRTREHFRDAIVREVDGHHVTVEFVDGGSETYWNHEDLPSLLSSGDPVGVHSEFHLLIAGFKALNLADPGDI